jgi:uncharacterized protein YdaU (DUF1376 family)
MYRKRGEVVGLPANELYAIAYEAITMKILKQEWLESDGDLPSLFREAARNAINQRVKKEIEEYKFKLSSQTVSEKDLLPSEIADKHTVFRLVLGERVTNTLNLRINKRKPLQIKIGETGCDPKCGKLS